MTAIDNLPRRWVRVALGVALVVHFFVFLGVRPLWVPDEGRYGEIAREMVETGDWLTPRLGGVRFFEKPPLVYWLSAASMMAFGQTEWAARLPVALAGLAGVALTFVLGTAVGGRRIGLLAALILSTCPEYYALSNFLVMDMVFTTMMAGGLLALWIALSRTPGDEPPSGTLFVASGLLALATLAKGIIGIVLPAMVLVPHLIHAPVRIRDWPWARMLGVYLAITAPWFLAMEWHHPGFLHFFVIREHFQRYLTTVHDRYQPFWYFVPVVLAGAFPWTCFLPATLCQPKRLGASSSVFLWSWVVLPVVFFSLSSSKLASYVLPIFPALAVLVAATFCDVIEEDRESGESE